MSALKPIQSLQDKHDTRGMSHVQTLIFNDVFTLLRGIGWGEGVTLKFSQLFVEILAIKEILQSGAQLNPAK